MIPPSELVDPGLHACDGHFVTFWAYVEPTGPPSPRAAGRGLRLIHDALEDYAGELPPRRPDLDPLLAERLRATYG